MAGDNSANSQRVADAIGLEAGCLPRRHSFEGSKAVENSTSDVLIWLKRTELDWHPAFRALRFQVFDWERLPDQERLQHLEHLITRHTILHNKTRLCVCSLEFGISHSLEDLKLVDQFACHNYVSNPRSLEAMRIPYLQSLHTHELVHQSRPLLLRRVIHSKLLINDTILGLSFLEKLRCKHRIPIAYTFVQSDNVVEWQISLNWVTQ
mmetsp:Transcript_71238/g.170598  ORF Transcript_71238/g.170598 Transcript_71238/m.170598 type:complete len:208 (+) Transcript_71238:1379-2002(+)